MKLVTVRTFDNTIDAHLLKAKLESEAINCFLFDENITALYPLYNISIGGIKLKVNENDVELASAIINDYDQLLLTEENGETLKCPKCQSEEVITGYKSMRGAKGFFSIIISLLFTVYPIYYKNVSKCKSCGNEF